MVLSCGDWQITNSYQPMLLNMKQLSSMKYVLQGVERNASTDNAPVLICSNYIESDFTVMPLESPKASPLFAPLSYYRLGVPVVPLPRDLNNETVRVASLFFEQAEQKHERFLAMAHFGTDFGSYETLEWLEQKAPADYTFRKVGVINGFEILEFLPNPRSARGF